MRRFRSKAATLAQFLREGEFLRPLLLVVNASPPSVLHVRMEVLTRARSIPTFRAPAHVRFRHLQPDDRLDRLPAPHGRDRGLFGARMRQELEDGREVCVAEQDGRIVGYVWVARRHHQLTKVRFALTLDADEACTYRAYVEPAHRFSWVYPGLVSYAYTELKHHGVRSVLGYGDMMNRHSIRTHERLGYQPVGWVCLVTFPGIALQFTRLGWRGEGIRCHVLGRAARHPPTGESSAASSTAVSAETIDGGPGR